MSIEKIAGDDFVNPGGITTFKITVKNNGDAIARNVILKDALPNGFLFKDTGLSYREWNLGDILPGFSQTITYQVIVSETTAAGQYANTATAEAENTGSVSVQTTIEVRVPEVKGEETTKLPEKLPHTGNSFSFGFITFLSLIALAFGAFGLTKTALGRTKSKKIISTIKYFLKRGGKPLKMAAYSLVIISALITISYPFWPAISYEIQSLEEPGLVQAQSVGSSSENIQENIESASEPTQIAAPKINENYLIIPKIGVEIPIVEGVDESALEKGAWLLPQTSTPDIGGNTALAAHRFKYRPPSKQTFYLLDKVSVNDSLKIIWEGKEYNYRVSWVKVVKPEDVQVLENTKKPSLTLITCTPLFSDKERLVVRGELLE